MGSVVLGRFLKQSNNAVLFLSFRTGTAGSMNRRTSIKAKPQVGHPDLKLRRVLLKLSGEALGGVDGSGLDQSVLRHVSIELKEIFDLGVQLGIVVGGGNIFRGLAGAAKGMDRAQADYMGMLATVINSLALQDALEAEGVPTRVMSALDIVEVAEPHIRRKAIAHLERGNVVIFAAGTGSPFFSTDTAAALRGVEIEADCVLKATKVDGVYDRDPVKHPEATRFSTISYDRFLADRIGVMDSTAASLCRENDMPIRVFAMTTKGNFRRVCMGEDVGTLVSSEGLR